MSPDAERINDTRISPLIDTIHAICKEHGIPFFCTFQLDNHGLHCTSAGEYEGSDEVISGCLDLRGLGRAVFEARADLTYRAMRSRMAGLFEDLP